MNTFPPSQSNSDQTIAVGSPIDQQPYQFTSEMYSTLPMLPQSRDYEKASINQHQYQYPIEAYSPLQMQPSYTQNDNFYQNQQNQNLFSPSKEYSVPLYRAQNHVNPSLSQNYLPLNSPSLIEPEVVFCTYSNMAAKGINTPYGLTMQDCLSKILNSPPLNCAQLNLKGSYLLSNSFLEQKIVYPLSLGNPFLSRNQILSSKTVFCVQQILDKLKSTYLNILILFTALFYLILGCLLVTLNNLKDVPQFIYNVLILVTIYNSITLILNWRVFKCNLCSVQAGNVLAVVGMFVNFLSLPLTMIPLSKSNVGHETLAVLGLISLNLIVQFLFIPFSLILAGNLKKMLAVTKQMPITSLI